VKLPQTLNREIRYLYSLSSCTVIKFVQFLSLIYRFKNLVQFYFLFSSLSYDKANGIAVQLMLNIRNLYIKLDSI